MFARIKNGLRIKLRKKAKKVKRVLKQEDCNFTSLKTELKAHLRSIAALMDETLEGLDQEKGCLLSEFELLKEKCMEAESLAATFYLKCYLSSYTHKYEEISLSVRNLTKRRYGALIVIQRNDPILPLITPGVAIGAELTHSLLESIFVPGGPLHDGAVWIQQDRIVSAANILPLTGIVSPEKKLGTRHRAAIGLSERCDALVIVVSEETGRSSFGVQGKLYPFAAQ